MQINKSLDLHFVPGVIPFPDLDTKSCPAGVGNNRVATGVEQVSYLECYAGNAFPGIQAEATRCHAEVQVGRYFPMTLCRKNEPGTNPLTQVLNEKAWFGHAEQIIKWTLENDFDTHKFNEQLNELEIDTVVVDSQQETENSQNQHLALRWSIEPEMDLITRMPEMLNKVLLKCSFAYSVWWTDGSEEVGPSILICQGLPPLDSAAALLDGNWDQWGWDDGGHNGLFTR